MQTAIEREVAFFFSDDYSRRIVRWRFENVFSLSIREASLSRCVDVFCQIGN
jgi:hypothetical protein